jgi:hypothetical protein
MINDTHVHVWHPPTLAHAVTGTFADAAGAVAGTIVLKRSAAASTGVITVPLKVPMNDGPEKGAYLVSIDCFWENLVAVTTSTDLVINKFALPADTAAFPAATALAFTYDTGHDTAPERLTFEQHTCKLTLTTPIWVEDDFIINIQATFVCGAAVIIDWIGVRANYTLRL